MIMNRGRKVKHYIIATALLLLVLAMNIIIIGSRLKIIKTEIDIYQNTFIHLESIQDSVSTLSGWQTLLFYIDNIESEYMTKQKIDESIKDLNKRKKQIKSLYIKDETYKKQFTPIENSIDKLLDIINKNIQYGIKAQLDDSVEIEFRSISQLLKSQISLLESELLYTISSLSRSLFHSVGFYLSIEITLLLITVFSLILSNKKRSEAESKTRKIRNHLNSIIDLMPSDVLVVNPDYNITLWNQNALTRNKSSDLEGINLASIFPKDSNEYKAVQYCITHNQISKFRGHRRVFHGLTIFENITIYPITFDKYTEAVIMIENITDLVTLKDKILKSEEKFKALVENLGEEYLFFTLNNIGEYTYISPSIKDMMGYDEVDFSDNYKKYLTNSKLNDSSIRKKNLSVKGFLQNPYMFEIRDNHGKNHFIEITEKPIINLDKTITVEGIAHDVTKREKNSRELTLYKNSLEDIVLERTKELESSLKCLQVTQEKLIESEKISSLAGLVAGVAHEINTPVGIIITSTSHLEEELQHLQRAINSGFLTKSMMENYCYETKEITKLILSSSIKASELISSFKEIAVDQSNEVKQDINIKKYIKEIILSHNNLTKDIKVDFNIICNDNLIINSYPRAISIIISNLIQNSIIHGFMDKKQGYIEIKVTLDNNNMDINYIDDGNGLNEDCLKKIYDPFFTTQRGLGAKGLGMSIVYNLVSKTLDGNISCFSKPNKGVSFNIAFKL